jgi:hypothetical protein
MSSAEQKHPLFPINACECLTPQSLRVLQIIAGALLLGVILFLAIVFYLLAQNQGQSLAPQEDLPVVTLVAVALMALWAPLAFAVPSKMTKMQLRQILAGKWTNPPLLPSSTQPTGGALLWAVHQNAMIVGLALLEGSAFLGCIAYLLEAQAIALGVVGAAIVLMLCRFPTEARVRTWLERHAAVLTEMRQHEVQYGRL